MMKGIFRNDRFVGTDLPAFAMRQSRPLSRILLTRAQRLDPTPDPFLTWAARPSPFSAARHSSAMDLLVKG
jgi:hypothetical protein